MRKQHFLPKTQKIINLKLPHHFFVWYLRKKAIDLFIKRFILKVKQHSITRIPCLKNCAIRLYIESVYTIALRGCFRQHGHSTRKIQQFCLKTTNLFSRQLWCRKYQIIRWGTRLYTPLHLRLLPSVHYPVHVHYLTSMKWAREQFKKKNLDIQNVLFHQKASNLVNSLFLTNATSVNV